MWQDWRTSNKLFSLRRVLITTDLKQHQTFPVLPTASNWGHWAARWQIRKNERPKCQNLSLGFKYLLWLPIARLHIAQVLVKIPNSVAPNRAVDVHAVPASPQTVKNTWIGCGENIRIRCFTLVLTFASQNWLVLDVAVISILWLIWYSWAASWC